MRKVFHFVICILISIANAAERGVLAQDFRSIISIPTPNTAVLLKDYNIPIDYYRGKPEITIPLHTLSLAGMQVPISLSYDASGVRIDQAPTWAGLGWDLTCGGFIVRKINGIRDELRYRGYMYSQRAPGTSLPDWEINEASFDNVPTSGFVNDADAGLVTYFLNNGMDSAPDEFYFTINGKTGKFYLDRNGIAVTDSDFHIAYTEEPNFLLNFTLTDEFGNMYNFATREYQLCTVNTVAGSPWGGETIESGGHIEWYLNSMESPDGLTKINFEYDTSMGEYSISGSRVDASSEQYKVTTKDGSIYKMYDASIARVEQGMIFLSRIYTDTEEIIFDKLNYSTGYYIRRALEKIRIKNRLTGQEWFYRFTRADFGNQTQKFLLTSILKGNESNEELFYHFDYNIGSIDYATGSCFWDSYSGIDHWGYYNGPATYKTRIPVSGNIVRDDAVTLTPINRNPVPAYARTGTLEIITLPTNGKIHFEYENNDYGFVGNSALSTTKLAGGLRLKKITYKDDLDDSNDISKLFTYQSDVNPTLSSGVVPFEPVYNFLYSTNTYSCNFWSGTPILPIDVGYSQVTELNSDGSKTVYRFNTAKEYPPAADPDDVKIIYNVMNSQATDFKFKRDTDTVNPYLVTDNVNTHLRGSLKDKIIFNSNGHKLVESHFEYISWNVGHLFSISSFSFDLTQSIGPNSYNIDGMPYSISFLKKTYVNIGRYKLAQENTRTYRSGDLTVSLDEGKTYGYNSNYLIKEITEGRSDNKQMKTIFTYPSDYNSSAMGGIIGSLNHLKAKGTLIEKIKTVDNRIISGQVTEYDALARPTKLYELETDGSLTYSPSLMNPDNPISLPSYYKIKQNYRFYSGRLTEIKTYDYPNSWQWGYANTKVIAKTENASYDDSFHSSFEDNGVSDANAKSGAKTKPAPYTFSPPSWLTPAANSKLSYWYWNGQWIYHEQNYSGGNVTLGNGSKIDELRIHPKDARMTTFTHDILGGASGILDSNAIGNFYEYDPVGRLQRIRDDKQNVITMFTYRYKN